eukprot:CAMPEP_0173208284 /NCGR_PEP_ID=MMETSP1141-20130122/22428_1 /TAXON_ID=483371 /ORGANISM="non described non described, Strain CCMP2298" /LENGTH=64 /DNA_ID=CAMNT_0014134713 /DNA_START=162 /DNA_END=352 /DNA_ORIENTATION=+
MTTSLTLSLVTPLLLSLCVSRRSSLGVRVACRPERLKNVSNLSSPTVPELLGSARRKNRLTAAR